MFQCSQPVVFPFTVTACVLLSRGHKDFSLILPSKSVILLLLVYIYAVHQELYECFELGQGGKFFSCGYPVSSALFTGKASFPYCSAVLEFSKARRLCVWVCWRALCSAALVRLPRWPGAPSLPCWGFGLQQVGCFPTVLSFSDSAVFASWLPCNVQSQLTNFNKNACWDCD